MTRIIVESAFDLKVLSHINGAVTYNRIKVMDAERTEKKMQKMFIQWWKSSRWRRRSSRKS